MKGYKFFRENKDYDTPSFTNTGVLLMMPGVGKSMIFDSVFNAMRHKMMIEKGTSMIYNQEMSIKVIRDKMNYFIGINAE